MRITEISIQLGETVNLGDYSNFRPEIGMTATIEPFDEADEVFAELADEMFGKLGAMVDDALELAGREPKYTAELYQVRFSELRQYVVIARKGLALPQDENWRDKDRWLALDGDQPAHMRFETAQKLATAAAVQKLYGILVARYPLDLTLLPALPDPGPEPLWSKKGLKSWLERIFVPQTEWDMLAALPHVTPEYIQLVYRTSPFSNYDKLKDAILAVPVAQADEDNDDRPENERFPDDWDEEE